MRSSFLTVLAAMLLAGLGSTATGAEPAQEADFYRLIPFPMTEHVNLEAGGLALLPNGKLAISTRRGDIYLLDEPFADPPERVRFTQFASGLHEVLGLAYRDGWLYATQRGEVTRIKDEDGDGRGDLFETVNAGWEIDGDYHEYAFGSNFDREGNLWVALCLTGSFSSKNKYRGWALRISPEGKLIPTCSGLRSPGGLGMNAEGDMFYTDNQGPWNGACSLKWLRPGSFQGHPGGNGWYDITEGAIGPRPAEPQTKSRMLVEAKKIPELEPPACYFPYNKMGQSASGIACDTTGGKFGPFAGQMFVGDQTHSTVMRVALEKVQGHYQGACFPFRQGIGSGSLSLLMSKDGSLFVGGTNRGWGSRGSQPYSLDRLVWTGKVPFEVHSLSVRPDGFDLKFTKPVDLTSASDLQSYKLNTFCYIYQADYGSPEVDPTTPTITKASVASDGLSVRLTIHKLQEGHVHELHFDGVRSASAEPVLHPVAYYTLNYLP